MIPAQRNSYHKIMPGKKMPCKNSCHDDMKAITLGWHKKKNWYKKNCRSVKKSEYFCGARLYLPTFYLPTFYLPSSTCERRNKNFYAWPNPNPLQTLDVRFPPRHTSITCTLWRYEHPHIQTIFFFSPRYTSIRNYVRWEHPPHILDARYFSSTHEHYIRFVIYACTRLINSSSRSLYFCTFPWDHFSCQHSGRDYRKEICC